MKNLITYLSKKSLSLGNGSGMTRKWFGNDSGMTRFSLASLICLCMLTVGVGNAWGAGSISVSTSMKIFPAGSTSVANNAWKNAGAPSSYPDLAADYTINSNGSFTFYNAADFNSDSKLQLKKNGGYIQSAITSPAGVDVIVGLKKGGSKGTLTIQLSGASDQTYGSTDWGVIKISTTSTSATLKIIKTGDNTACISYIIIIPRQAGGSGDYVLVESAGDIGAGKYLLVYNNATALNTHSGNTNANTYGTGVDISSYYSSKTITANATTNAYAYEIISTANGYCIRKSSEYSYLGFNSTAQNPVGSYLRWDTGFTPSENEWTLGVNSIVSYFNSSYAIRYNSGSPRFAIYGPSNQSAVQLFKKVDAPSCADPTALTKGTISLSDRTAQVQPINWTSAAGKVDICYSSTNSSKPGATPGSGYTVISGETGSTSTSNTYNLNITSFAAGNYYVWARSVCDASSKSDWVAITGSYFTIPGHTLTISADPDGSGTFSKSPDISTVVENRQVAITASPAAGYTFTSWAVSGTGSSLSSTSTNPTTFTMGTANATVTATFTAKTLSSISLDETAVTIYDQQYTQIGVTYDPSDILTKGYTLVASPTKVVTTGSTNAQLKISATKAGVTITSQETETVSIKANADNTKTASVTVTINPLPKVHFVDLVHGKEFSDVAGTISANVLVSSKTTPTSDDWDSTYKNDCEEDHVHLVGWIRSDWPELVAYLTGTGDLPETDDITDAGNDGSGNAYYFTAGASINVLTFDGKTFYAVWAKAE